MDLVPLKTCSFDCLYCQLGRTTCKTIDRKEWVPLAPLLEELETRLDARPDYVTLGGSGEPTLFRPLDALIEGIRRLTDAPIAVLTNGSLLGREDVRRELRDADFVIPSLDAGDEATFRLVNRPHEALSFEQLLAGLIDFRRRFRGPVWLEVFLLHGYTTSQRALDDIRRGVELIRPDRVQLNTVARPPAEDRAVAVPRGRLEEIAATFSPPAEVIADFHVPGAEDAGMAGRDEIVQLLRRRPCSIDDLAGGLGLHRNEVLKSVEHLAADGIVEATTVGGRLYYRARPAHS